jgi:hypothetical protein
MYVSIRVVLQQNTVCGEGGYLKQQKSFSISLEENEMSNVKEILMAPVTGMVMAILNLRIQIRGRSM